MSDKTLVQKMAEVMAEVGYVQKDSVNDFHKYRYASAEAILKKVNAALSSRGIAVQSHAELVSHEVIPSEKGPKVLAVVKLSMDFTDGTDSLHAEGLGSGMDSGDKAVMKGNTAAAKYLVANAFFISWGDDPEADSRTDREPAEKMLDAEDPFGDKEPPVAYQQALPIVATLRGKRGVKELRQFFGHCSMAGMTWNEVEVYAESKGVAMGLPLSLVNCVKLRDLIKQDGREA